MSEPTRQQQNRVTRIDLGSLREHGLFGKSSREYTPSSSDRDDGTSKKRKYPTSKRVFPASSHDQVLDLPQAVEHNFRAHEYIRQRHESIWNSYRKVYRLRLGAGERVVVAGQRGSPWHVVTVRSLSGPKTEQHIAMLQTVRHENIISPIEIFWADGLASIVFEHMPISLFYLAGNPEIDERCLAAILGQVVNGLSFIADSGLAHGSLSSSNILLNSEGLVKLSEQENCQKLSTTEVQCDIRTLGIITMEVMQGYTKAEGAVGVDDLIRWPPDCRAVGFLSETTSATSFSALLGHSLLKLPWHPDQLRSLVSFGMVEVRRGFEYPIS